MEDLDLTESLRRRGRVLHVDRQKLKTAEKETGEALEHAFDFMEQVSEKGQEMVIFVTELTLDTNAVLYLLEHGCERYLKYKEELLIGTKRAELLEELKR